VPCVYRALSCMDRTCCVSGSRETGLCYLSKPFILGIRSAYLCKVCVACIPATEGN
jgi:hypothetical protein